MAGKASALSEGLDAFAQRMHDGGVVAGAISGPT